MRRRSWLAVLMAPLWSCAVWATAPPLWAAAPNPEHFDVQFELSPRDSKGAYVCKAVVTDMATGRVLASPVLTIRKGSPGSIRVGRASADELGRTEVLINANVSNAGLAVIKAEIFEDHLPVQRHFVSMWLR